MGRPPLTLTETQRAEVETLAAVLSASQIADYFGIGRTTFFAMIQRDAEIAERYKKGKARAIGAIAQSLVIKARSGDTASMIFYLKTQAGWRETVQVETREEWAPVRPTLADLSDAEISAMMAYLDGAIAAQLGQAAEAPALPKEDQ